MKSKALQWLAIALILETGLLHYFTAQSAYEQVAYMGYVFMLNFLGALIAAFGIYHRQAWGWGVGAAVTTASMIGYVLSRTVGLPGLQVELWLDPYRVVAFLVEGLFLLVILLRPWKMIPPLEEQVRTARWLRYLLPVSAVFVMGMTSFVSYRWDVSLNQSEFHQHVGNLAQVCNTPLTSFAELEQKYGVQISQVAATEMGSVIDVRLKIIDPDKAHALLINQAAILVNTDFLILAPHLHTHYKLKPNKLFMMFFSSGRGSVHAGSEVSLVFGHVRVAPVTVR